MDGWMEGWMDAGAGEKVNGWLGEMDRWVGGWMVDQRQEALITEPRRVGIFRGSNLVTQSPIASSPLPSNRRLAKPFGPGRLLLSVTPTCTHLVLGRYIEETQRLPICPEDGIVLPLGLPTAVNCGL